MSVVSQLRGVDSLVRWTEVRDDLPGESVLCVVQLRNRELRFAVMLDHCGWISKTTYAYLAGSNPVMRWLEVTADIEASMLEMLKPIGVVFAVSHGGQIATVKTTNLTKEIKYRTFDVSERDE